MHNLFIVPLPILVKLPRLGTELDKEVHLSTLAPVDCLGLAGDDAAAISFSASPYRVHLGSYRPACQTDPLSHMHRLRLQKHPQAPHVCPPQILGEPQLDVIDVRRCRVPQLQDLDVGPVLKVERGSDKVWHLDLPHRYIRRVWAYPKGESRPAQRPLDPTQRLASGILLLPPDRANLEIVAWLDVPW